MKYIVCVVCLVFSVFFCFKNSNNKNKTNKSGLLYLLATTHNMFSFFNKIMAGMVKKIEYFVAVDEWMCLKPGIWLYHCGRRQQEYSTYNLVHTT